MAKYVNLLKTKGLRYFPPDKQLHGYRVRGYKDSDGNWTPDARPEWCRLGNAILRDEEGKVEILKGPCFACKTAMRVLKEKSSGKRRRITGRRLVSAFFRP
jgi:hypothetical protein